MPEMNGVALAGALQGQNPNCKVILISGNSDSIARGNLQGGTFDGFTLLPKPFSTSQLLHLIKSERG
jgi:FixJ family two-component response regulator